MDFRFQGLKDGFPVLLALATITVASTSQAQVLTEREAYDQIVRAISEQLGVRRLAYPDYPGISQVFWTGTDWGFVMGDGIKLDSSTNFQAALPGRFQKSLVIETQSGVVIVTRPDEQTGYDTNSHLAVTVKDERGMKQSLFRGYRQVGLHLQKPESQLVSR